MVAVKRRGKEKSLVTSNKFNILSREVNECIISHGAKGGIISLFDIKDVYIKVLREERIYNFLLTPFFSDFETQNV